MGFIAIEYQDDLKSQWRELGERLHMQPAKDTMHKEAWGGSVCRLLNQKNQRHVGSSNLFLFLLVLFFFLLLLLLLLLVYVHFFFGGRAQVMKESQGFGQCSCLLKLRA